MKPHFLHLCVILLLVSFSSVTQAGTNDAQKESEQVAKTSDNKTVNIMSFNIRYGTAKDGPNAWPLRRDMASDLIRREMPDFVGTQEIQMGQTKYLLEKLPEYAVIYKSRDTVPSDQSEMCGLFFRKDRWSLDPEDTGHFWFSDTPEVPGSMGIKAGYPRITTWGRFIEKDPTTGKETGKSIYLFNTHFDNVSWQARNQAASMIAKRMAARKDKAIPALMMGDLNSKEQSWSIRYLLGKITNDQPPLRLIDPFRILHPNAKEVGTYPAFRFRSTNGPKIDYIFTTPDLKPLEAKILRNSSEDRYPSDHFPVTLKAVLP